MSDASVSSVFAGYAFHPGGRASGQLRVDGEVLRFDGEGVALTLPLGGLVRELGGFNDSVLTFRHPHHPQLTLHTADLSLLDHPRFARDPDLRRQRRTASRRKANVPMVIGCLVLAALVGLGVLVWLAGALVGWVADRIPVSLEVELGEAVYRSVEASGLVLADPELQGDLDAFAAPLLAAVPAGGFKFQLHVIEDPQVNAFALPGGHVVINTGLLRAAGSGEEVLGVLAHELAHVTQRHSLRQLLRSAGLRVLVQMLLGDAGGLIGLASEGGLQLAELSFSRDFEREADTVGWQYLVGAGIDPRGLIHFFERLLELQEQAGPGVDLAASFALLSTHPTSQERIDRLRTGLDGLAAGELPADAQAAFASLQQRLGPPPEGTEPAR